MGRPAVSFQILAAFFTVLWGTLTVLRLIWEIMRHPVRCFQRSTRDVPPACLTDPALGRHEYVTANGIKFHCVTLGERSKPLMLLLHGFPEVSAKFYLKIGKRLFPHVLDETCACGNIIVAVMKCWDVQGYLKPCVLAFLCLPTLLAKFFRHSVRYV